MNRIQSLLSENMRINRKRLGYSQMKLGELANLSPSFICDVETGRKFPSAQSLDSIARALGLHPFELFLDSFVIKPEERKEFINILFRLRKKINAEIEESIKKLSGPGT